MGSCGTVACREFGRSLLVVVLDVHGLTVKCHTSTYVSSSSHRVRGDRHSCLCISYMCHVLRKLYGRDSFLETSGLVSQAACLRTGGGYTLIFPAFF